VIALRCRCLRFLIVRACNRPVRSWGFRPTSRTPSRSASIIAIGGRDHALAGLDDPCARLVLRHLRSALLTPAIRAQPPARSSPTKPHHAGSILPLLDLAGVVALTPRRHRYPVEIRSELPVLLSSAIQRDQTAGAHVTTAQEDYPDRADAGDRPGLFSFMTVGVF